MKILGLAGIAIGATMLSAIPLSLRLSPTTLPSVSLDTADARVGRPLTPVSVAGVHRRAYRRGYGALGVGLGAGALATGAVAASSYYGGYGGYPYNSGYSGYYSGGYPSYSGGYANQSYVTGRPTLLPRYYGGSYAGYYGGGYAGNNGGYANRSYVTGRPTLLPRHYGGWGW